MKKKHFFIYFSIVVLLAGSLYVAHSIYEIEAVKVSSKQLKDYNQQEYLRIKIYGSSETEDGNTISGTFSILDTNGIEIAVIERSWNGAYLAIDFSEIKMDGRKFLFPTSIYGKQSIIQTKSEKNTGTTLEKYYNENRQCALLSYNSTSQERKTLFRIARLAVTKDNIFALKYKKTLTVDLSPCIYGKYYSIVRVPSGNILVREF